MNLEAIVKKYPYKKNLEEEDFAKGQFSHSWRKEAAEELSFCYAC